MQKDTIKFVPAFDVESNWYKIAVESDGDICGYVHWIESSNGCIVTINDLRLAKSICETEETIISACKNLQDLFENDQVGWKNVNINKP